MALCEWLKAGETRIEDVNLSLDCLDAYKLQVVVGKWDGSDRRATGEMFVTDEMLEDRTAWPAILHTIRSSFDYLYASEPMAGIPIKLEWNGNDLSR